MRPEAQTGGPRLLITRPEAAGQRFLRECEAVWGRPMATIFSPLQTIQPVDPPALPRPSALVLTSEAGAERAGALGLAAGAGDLPAWCVGPRTAAAARASGLLSHEAGPDADGLLAAILAARPTGLLLHLRGLHAAGDIAARLRAAGLDAAEAIVYAQVPQPLSADASEAFTSPAPVLAPLFSVRSATLLRKAVATRDTRAPLHLVALSDAVARAWEGGDPADEKAPVSASLTIAAAPNGEAMVHTTLERWAWLNARVGPSPSVADPP